MTNLSCKVLVVGAGPGGYVAAIRAGQLGLDTIIVEADKAGGTCLIRGCIPSKAMIHVATKFADMGEHASSDALGISLSAAPTLNMKGAVAWKDTIVTKLNTGVEALLKKAKVRTVKGWAKFTDGKTCEVKTNNGSVTIAAENIILATGSTATELPFMPYGGPVISSTEALDLDELPKKLAVIGAGYIGLELGIAYRKMGSDVTFVEAQDNLLPLFDKELTRPVSRWLREHGVTMHYKAMAKGLRSEGDTHYLEYTDAKGVHQSLQADKILVTVGRKPMTEGWGRENMAIDMDGPFVKVDDMCKTSMNGVYAIGDLVGEPMLAHKASAQGEMVAEIIAGKRKSFDPVAIPATCFTEPEVVSAGMSPKDAKDAGIKTVVGKFPFSANGRALAREGGLDGGFIRVTARADNHLVLGIQAVGAHVSELSGEFILALEMGARLEDIEGTIHVHPSMTEAFHEAALSALGHAIHI